MTTYIFSPTNPTQFVNWSSPAIWAGGVPPNSADADVVFPVIYAGGSAATFFVTISAGASYTVNSLTMSAGDSDYIEIYGTLTVENAVTLGASSELDLNGGVLHAGSLLIGGIDVQFSGTIDVAGAIDVQTQLGGGALTVNAGSLSVEGEITAVSGDLAITTAPGGFSNLANGVLTGGTYYASGQGNGSNVLGMLSFNVGGVVTTLAANLTVLQGGSIAFYDPASGQYLDIGQTLHTVTAAGAMSFGPNESVQFGALTDSGAISLNSALFNTSGLTITPGGRLSGGGAVIGSIVNNGLIDTGGMTSGATPSAQSLFIEGSVTGTGHFQIDAELVRTGLGGYGVFGDALELGGASNEDVVFAQGDGLLILDQPSTYSGTISAASIDYVPNSLPGGQPQSLISVVLKGVNYASVTGYSYANGVLTIQTAQGAYTLRIGGGAYQTVDFTLGAGPQPLSTNPPSLLVSFAPKVLAPTISGTQANQKVSAEEPDRPFAGVSVAGASPSDTLNVTVTMSAAANGALAAPIGGFNASAGVYTLSGTAAEVTAALRAMVFTPNDSGLAAGSGLTTGFTIAAADATTNSAAATDAATSVIAFAGLANDGGASGALVLGAPGNDTLATSAPLSFVYGGGGFDIVTLKGPGEIVELNAPGAYGAWGPLQGLDIINGFVSGIDHLVIDESAFGVAPGGYAFVAGAPTSALPTFAFDPSTSYLWFDRDGTGPAAADLVAFLPGVTNLSAGDLTLAQVAFDSNANVVNSTPGTTTYGEGPNETLWASAPNVTLVGGPYREQFIAQAAHDVVFAGAGGAFIAALGGYGQFFAGASGADAFYFNSPNLGVDTIHNFSEANGDSFVLQGSAFAAPAGFRFTDGLGFVMGPGASALAATATLAFDTSTSYLWFDPDGTGPAARALLAFLPGTQSLKAADFSVA